MRLGLHDISDLAAAVERMFRNHFQPFLSFNPFFLSTFSFFQPFLSFNLFFLSSNSCVLLRFTRDFSIQSLDRYRFFLYTIFVTSFSRHLL
jgi:hypothetical protein